MGCDEVSAATVREWLVTQVARELKRPVEKIDIDKTFARLGLDSVSILSITGDLSDWLKRDFSTTLLQEHPTITALADHVAQECSAAGAGDQEKREILLARDQWLPVTMAQERVLKYANFDARGDGNILTEVFIIRGRLDLGALRDALTEIVRRHEVLRTTFRREEGRLEQWVHSLVPVEVEEYDLTATEHPTQEAAALATRLIRESMQLDRGPLFRARLLRVGVEIYRVVFTFHHVLMDAVSLELFHAELSYFYEQCRGGNPSCEPGPVMQMAELAAWERKWLEKSGAPYQERMTWWHTYWQDLGSLPLNLPIRWRETPAVVLEPSGCRLKMHVPPDLPSRARDLAAAAAATPYLVWLAGFAAFLHQETGRDDFVIGTYVSQRKTTAAQHSIGMFTTMVPVRIRIMEPWTFREFLARIVEEMSQVALHQELPPDDLFQSLLEAGRSRPEVKVIFNFVREPADSFRLSGLGTEAWSEVPPAKMPWGFVMRLLESADRMICESGCDGNLYDPAETRRMGERYLARMEALLENPDQQATLLPDNPVHDATAAEDLW